MSICLFRFEDTFEGGAWHFTSGPYIPRAVSKSSLWQKYPLCIKILICKYWWWEVHSTKLQPVCARVWFTSSCTALVTQASGTWVSFYTFDSNIGIWIPLFPSLHSLWVPRHLKSHMGIGETSKWQPERNPRCWVWMFTCGTGQTGTKSDSTFSVPCWFDVPFAALFPLKLEFQMKLGAVWVCFMQLWLMWIQVPGVGGLLNTLWFTMKDSVSDDACALLLGYLKWCSVWYELDTCVLSQPMKQLTWSV